MTDIPAWIGAIGTVGTLSTGLILFANTMSDRRREYAKLVAVWTDFGKIDEGSLRTISAENLKLDNIIDPASGASISRIAIGKADKIHFKGGAPEGFFGFRLNLKNNGLQPIYDCALFAYLENKALPPGRYPVLFDKFEVKLGIIAPGVEISNSLLIGAPNDEASLPEALVEALTFTLQFTDTAGRRWVRNESGQLKRPRRWTKAPTVPHRPAPIIAGTYVAPP